jgi:hypothetical protein
MSEYRNLKLPPALDPIVAYMKTFSKDTISVIRRYMGTLYTNINETARRMPSNLDVKSLDDSKYKYVKYMEDAFRNAPELKEELTVYRGTSRDFGTNIFNYISTSLSPSVAKRFVGEFNCCFLKINISSGCKVLPLLIYNSPDQDELEILIHRDVEFVVTNTRKTKIFPYDDDEYTIMDIVCVPKTRIKLDLTKNISDIYEYMYVRKIMWEIYDRIPHVPYHSEIIKKELRKSMEKDNPTVNFTDKMIDDIYFNFISR